jgi:hypothetical protein
MATTIKLKNSVTTTNAPSSLVQGEVAINITDKKVWVGNAATTPIQLLGDGGSASFTSIAFGAGTVSSPSITFTGDTNTGIYSPAADTIAFTEGGVEAMRIDSSGNVLVNTTSTGASGLNIANNRNISFAEGSGVSYANMFRQTSSAALVLAMGYKYTDTSNGFASSVGTSIAKSAISLGTVAGGITFYADSATTVANGTDATPSERMRITSGGDVGIGTSSPVGKVDISGLNDTGGVAVLIRNTSDIGNTTPFIDLRFSQRSNGADGGRIRAGRDGIYSATASTMDSFMAFYTAIDNSDTERMRITSGGGVGIGVTPNTANRLEVKGADSTSGTQSLYCTNSNGTAQLFLRNDNYFNSVAIANYSVAGTALVIDSGNYVGKTTSSLRYKKDIVDYDKGLDAIAKLRPVYYKSAVEGPNGLDPKQHAGFIAEEIADEGFEEFLVRNLDGEPDAVQYAQMTALLCKAIQELKAELDSVKAELNQLKGA